MRLPRRILGALSALAGTLVLCASASGQPQVEATPAPTAPPPPSDPAAMALAGFDEETGLWFPPDAPRDVYLNRSDPNRNWIEDVQKAFKANPALRKEVCALSTDPKREPRWTALTPYLKQRITMFHLLCDGIAWGEEEKARSEKAWRDSEARYLGWMNVAAARKLTLDERRARFRELDETPVPPVNEASLQRAFEMLGMLPQTSYSVYHVLDASPFRSLKPEARFLDFLRRTFEREAGEGMPEPALYRMALRHLFLYTGDLDACRAMSRRVLEDEALAQWRTDNLVLLALLDRLAGDASALKNAAASCDPPELQKPLYKDRPAAEYCWDLVLRASTDSIHLLGEKAPKGLVGVLSEVIAAEPARWWNRYNAIHYVAVLDPARARALADELLALPATLVPLDIRLEALAEVGDTSRVLRDFPRALRAYDFYLDTLRYRPAPVPADVWARLKALPEDEEGPSADHGHLGWLNITWALGRKIQTSIDAADFARARVAIEDYLATSFLLMESTEKEKQKLLDLVGGESMEPAERETLRTFLEKDAQAAMATARIQARWARTYLGRYGTALVSAKRKKEAERIVRYLIAQPGGERHLPTELYPLFYGAKDRGEPLQPAASPWDAASVAWTR